MIKRYFQRTENHQRDGTPGSWRVHQLAHLASHRTHRLPRSSGTRRVSIGAIRCSACCCSLLARGPADRVRPITAPQPGSPDQPVPCPCLCASQRRRPVRLGADVRPTGPVLSRTGRERRPVELILTQLQSCNVVTRTLASSTPINSGGEAAPLIDWFRNDDSCSCGAGPYGPLIVGAS